MFTEKDFSVLDSEYLDIISLDPYDVIVISKNTRHVWYIHNPEYPRFGSCVIFHKHKVSHPYHQHGRSNSLRQAVKGIRKHDQWQINGRCPYRCKKTA